MDAYNYKFIARLFNFEQKAQQKSPTIVNKKDRRRGFS